MIHELKILVVEDQEEAAIPMCAILEAEGYSCHLAATGREAIALARRLRPHVMLLDIELPDLSGIDVYVTLRDGDDLKGCRVLAVTGHTDEETRERCRRAGIDDFVSKPLEIDDLLRKMAIAEES